MNVMNVTTPTTPEIFGILGILVTSFNELVHHMTADYGLLLVIVLGHLVSLGWAWLEAAPYWSIVRHHQRRLKNGDSFDLELVPLSRRLAKATFNRRLGQTPTVVVNGVLAACVLDYLVLVFLNLVGW